MWESDIKGFLVQKQLGAYEALYAAATAYYRALNQLQTGHWDITEIKDAERKMQEAEAQTIYITLEDGKTWIDFWQHATFIRESIHGQSGNGVRELWETQVKEFAERIKGFRDAAKAEIQRRMDQVSVPTAE